METNGKTRKIEIITSVKKIKKNLKKEELQTRTLQIKARKKRKENKSKQLIYFKDKTFKTQAEILFALVEAYKTNERNEDCTKTKRTHTHWLGSVGLL